ncbi:MAG: hypothetical protein ACP5G6_03175, partial [Conexivisphaera sp.]
WGIETSYSVQDGFEARTCSRSHTIRMVYFMLSIMLYNSWAMMGLLDWGRATAYRYRDCMAEEAVEGMPRIILSFGLFPRSSRAIPYPLSSAMMILAAFRLASFFLLR